VISYSALKNISWCHTGSSWNSVPKTSQFVHFNCASTKFHLGAFINKFLDIMRPIQETQFLNFGLKFDLFCRIWLWMWETKFPNFGLLFDLFCRIRRIWAFVRINVLMTVRDSWHLLNYPPLSFWFAFRPGVCIIEHYGSVICESVTKSKKWLTTQAVFSVLHATKWLKTTVQL